MRNSVGLIRRIGVRRGDYGPEWANCDLDDSGDPDRDPRARCPQPAMRDWCEPAAGHGPGCSRGALTRRPRRPRSTEEAPRPARRPATPGRGRLRRRRRRASTTTRRAGSGAGRASPTTWTRSPTTRGALAMLRDDLRAELRTAASALARLDRAAARRSTPAPLRALLDRVRIGIDGEIALGLAFQGSYSQARVKEPVYGGHASAMGPAPRRQRHARRCRRTSTVRGFDERAHASDAHLERRADQGPHPRVGRQRRGAVRLRRRRAGSTSTS